MGRDGGYTQDDVVAASRAFTGWVVDIPGRPVAQRLRASRRGTRCSCRGVTTPAPRRCSARPATFDIDGALDVILSHPSTARFVTAEAVPRARRARPDRRRPSIASAKAFRRDYEIMPLVEAIAHDDAFVSDAAVRAKYRTPVEKLVGHRAGDRRATPRSGGRARPARGAGTARRRRRRAAHDELPARSCRPTSAATRRARACSGRSSLVHTFDLLQAVADAADDAAVGRRPVRAARALRRERPHSQGRREASTTRRRRLRSSVASPEYTVV